MTDGIDGRLRLTVLGGFLGSGKTTWLRHQLFAKTYGAVHVIVNEAAAAPLDDALLGRAQDLTLLAGACVCCAAKDRLQRCLLDLCDARSAMGPGTRLENVVLEASGLADPGAITQAIQAHPVLVRQIRVVETIVIVDAVNALSLIQQEPLSRRQIEAADRLILTKTETASAEQIALLCATLQMLAPGAEQSAVAFGSPLAWEPPQGGEPIPLPESDGADMAPITAHRLDLGETPDWTAFTVWLSALLYVHGDQIVRVKGVVRTPAGRLLLQTVRRSVQAPEILPDAAPCPTDNSIAVIGRGTDQGQLARSLARFVSPAS